MKKTLFYLILLLGNIIFSQTLLPKVAPVSPEAASLGKYGDVPVNLATGRINYTVPLFTIKEGGYEFPIYLSYNHSGLLAEEDPGVVGLGWVLHAGGSVVRQLRGKPDEGSLGYVKDSIGKNWVVPFNFNRWDGLSNDERTRKISNLFEGAESGRLDTQPDKFIISAPNISGNFSYNELGTGIFYPHKNYEVNKFFEDNNNFLVRDDSGVKYEFDVRERTFSEPVTNDEQANPTMIYTSRWCLTKITLPNSLKTISLDYKNGVEYNKTGFSESLTRLKLKDAASCNTGDRINKSQINTKIIAPKHISSIKFSSGIVEFDIRAVPNGSYSSGNKNYLHAVSIKNKFGDLVTRYEFIYNTLSSNFKLLQQIKKYGKDNKVEPFYSFQYNGAPPNSIEYTSQDYWGYFNGADNNKLIGGERNPNFFTSKIGSLRKIIYPTGGYTEIQYEPNRVPADAFSYDLEEKLCGSNHNSNLEVSVASDENSPNRVKEVSKSIVIPVSQTIYVSMSASTDGMYGEASAELGGKFLCNPYSECNMEVGSKCSGSAFSTIEMGGSQPNIEETTNPIGDANDGGTNGETGFETGYYEVSKGDTLVLSAKAMSARNSYASSGIRIRYYDPNKKDIDGLPLQVNVGGIRVASTKDCSSANKCVSKTYNYITEDNKSSGMILSNPKYSHDYREYPSQRNGFCEYTQTAANSSIPLSSFQGAPVLYSRVEILHNDDKTKGKRVKFFTFEMNPSPSFPYPPVNPKDWRKGQLKKEEIYAWKNDSFELIKEVANKYEVKYPYPAGLDKRMHSIGQLAGRVIYSYMEIGGNRGLITGDISHYREKSYNNRPEFYHLVSSKVTDYLSNKKVVTTTNYDYDNLTGYLDEQRSNSSDGKILRSKNIYPTNSRLVTENRISSPIKVETFVNDKPISVQETDYRSFQGGSLYLPKFIKTLKGVSSSTNQLEDRVIYHSYDSRGNPREVSKKDGTKIYYVWGYQQTQPIAKIVGYTAAQLANVQGLIKIAVSKSNVDKDLVSENALRAALKALRDDVNMKNAQVTTYTYDPLIGVTSITNPRGETVYYEYDDFNRLEFVKDNQGNILKEHKYNYKK